MKKTNIVAIALLAVASLAATFADAATGGDIYEIRRVDKDGNAIANPAAPLDGGDEVRFAVRLAKPSLPSKKFRLVKWIAVPINLILKN